MPISAIALFCDDIREERSGAVTLIGIMPDNVEVPVIPGALPRVGVYIRVHLDPNAEPKPIDLFLAFSDGNQHQIGGFPIELIQKASADALSAGNPLAGLVANVIVSPFPAPQAGRALVTLSRSGETQVIGGLNFVLARQGG